MKRNTNANKSNKDLAMMYEPEFFRLKNREEKAAFEQLLEEDIEVIDEIEGQLRELIKSLNPKIKIAHKDYPALIEQHLAGADIYEYGVWVYYPWSRRVLHLLDEDEFIEVRTNRNRYKLTRSEQAFLCQKKIGIVGLSVGQSIALTMAIERTAGELRLADFDTVELSNLNRIRTGLHNLGLHKTVLAAREIKEIDPFIKVRIFNDGLTVDNIDEFFTGEGKLDMLIEVCDGLDVKIRSRFKARELRIPVVMDTNDRGMLDVERYDLEPDRPILHGLAGDLNPDMIKDLTNEEKIPYILKMVGADTISTRLKASMMEVEQSINTWPQLASSVVLGGALTTDTARRILLDQFHDSGRYYIDFDELIADTKPVQEATGNVQTNPYQPLTLEGMRSIADKYLAKVEKPEYVPDDEQLDKIIDAAIAAPSAGNNQPWKWYFRNGWLLLFHDKYRSWSWGDYKEMGAHMGLGTAIENVHLQAVALGLTDYVQTFPLKDEPFLIASIRFEKAVQQVSEIDKLLADNLFNRNTNRMLGKRESLPIELLEQIQYLVRSSVGCQISYTEKPEQLDELGVIMSACDRIRMLNQQGHEEFFHEVRWNKEHAEATRDGIELAAVDLTKGEVAAFQVGIDWNAVSLLAQWNKGDAFRRFSSKTMNAASAAMLFAVDDFNSERLVEAGRCVQRVWIYLNIQGITVHPMLSPVFFFNRLVQGNGEGLTEENKFELEKLRENFKNIFPSGDNREYSEVFLMKLGKTDKESVQSLRLQKNDIFYKD